MPLKYTDYAEQVRNKEKLDLRVDDGSLIKIAEELRNEKMDGLTAELGLKHKILSDIKAANRDPATQRSELVRAWRDDNDQKATYKVLLNACVETTNPDAANKIVKYLNTLSPEFGGSSKPKKNSDDPPPAAKKEEPVYSKDEQKKDFRKNIPDDPPDKDSSEYNELSTFSGNIQVILQTVNENEYQAAVINMKPPNVPPSEKFNYPVIFPRAGSVVGMFGRSKVALIKTAPGRDVAEYVQDALKEFPKTKFVIGVGVGYAFDRTKYKFGDVLVSSQIDDLTNSKFDSTGNLIDRGQTIDIAKRLNKIFGGDFLLREDFIVTKGGRESVVFAGKYASYPLLINNKDERDKFQRAVPEVIAGEMEGGELLRFRQKGEVEGVIVIKGVVDYADGEKSKEWQFTAAMAALHYTKAKLDRDPFDA